MAKKKTENLWHCQNCGHEGEEEEFIPTDGSGRVVGHVCPECGSATEVFFKD